MGGLPEWSIAAARVRCLQRAAHVDQRLRHQQNVSKFEVGVVVVETDDTTLPNLRLVLPEIRAALDQVNPGAVIVVKMA